MAFANCPSVHSENYFRTAVKFIIVLVKSAIGNACITNAQNYAVNRVIDLRVTNHVQRY